MMDERFGWRELVMVEEMELIVSDLTSKIGAFAHLVYNGNACTETGLLAHRLLVLCTKFNILRYSDKLRKQLDHVSGIILIVQFSVLETGSYYLHNIICI